MAKKKTIEINWDDLSNLSQFDLEMAPYYIMREYEKRLMEIADKHSGSYTFKKPFLTFADECHNNVIEFMKKKGKESTEEPIKPITKFSRNILDGTTIVFYREGDSKDKYGHPLSYDFEISKMLIKSYQEENQPEPDEVKYKELEFNNKDIIITDPCYIIRHYSFSEPEPDYHKYGMTDEEYRMWPKDYSEDTKRKSDIYRKDYEEWRLKKRDWDEEHDDWSDCSYGYKFEELGITNYITADTLYGDWSCTTWNIDTGDSIGKFCADAGLVSVLDLDEVRKYNPDIDEWIKTHDWCVTKIPNFTGKVSMKVVKSTGTYERDSEYHKKGETWTQYDLRVFGNGSINFETSQTGL